MLLVNVVVLLVRWGVKRQSPLTRPPGTRLYAWVSFFYSRKTVERVFEPALADMREEYFAALANGRMWKAHWVRIAYYWAFTKSVSLHSLVSTVQEIVAFWKLLG